MLFLLAGLIALLLFLVLREKVPVFLAVLLVSVLTGLCFGLSPAEIVQHVRQGMGGTAGVGHRVVEAAGLSPAHTALLVIAIASGATVLSHVNDSGFWLVSRYLNLSVGETLRTWTVTSTLVGLVGFIVTLVISLFLP